MDSNVIKLSPRLDVKSAAALQEQLVEALGRDVALDAADVAYVDTSALQLLLAFVIDAPKAGGRVTWNKVSAPLAEGAKRLGLTTHLCLPQSTT